MIPVGELFFGEVVAFHVRPRRRRRGDGRPGRGGAGPAQGLRVALLEAHAKLGGCAGWFDRGPYTFDAGATALMGLGPDEPIGGLLAAVGLEFEAVRTPSYRVCLPDRTLDVVPDPDRFEANVRGGLPRPRRGQTAVLAAAGGRSARPSSSAAGRVPRLPLRSAGDLVHDLRVLGLRGLLAASTWPLTVLDVLRLLGLDDDRPFRALVAMLLQDTAQAGPETVPFANAAACLQAYRLGMSRPRGGMRAPGRRDRRAGSRRSAASSTDRRSSIGSRPTAEGGASPSSPAAAPAAGPAGRLQPAARPGRVSARPRADGPARPPRTAEPGRPGAPSPRYLAIRREAVPDDGPLFYQVLAGLRCADPRRQQRPRLALAPRRPRLRPGGRPRRHAVDPHPTRPTGRAVGRGARAAKKADYARSAARGPRPGACPTRPRRSSTPSSARPGASPATPAGTSAAVGGPPVSRRNSNFLAVGSDVLGPGLWVVGDSVFPGQGTMAVVLSAIRVVERITGRTLGGHPARAGGRSRPTAVAALAGS